MVFLAPSIAHKPTLTASGWPMGGKKRRKGRKAHFRSLHANPDRTRDVRASHCPCCARDVWHKRQQLCQAYDNIELPVIEPAVTRIHLCGGHCPNCATPRFSCYRRRPHCRYPRRRWRSGYQLPAKAHSASTRLGLLCRSNHRIRPSMSRCCVSLRV